MNINNKQIQYSLEQLETHKQDRKSIIRILYGIFRLLFIVVQNIYSISSYFILTWILFLPIYLFKSSLYIKLENYFYNSLLYVVSSWSLIGQLIIVECGDDFKSLIEKSKQNHVVDHSIEEDVGAEQQFVDKNPDGDTIDKVESKSSIANGDIIDDTSNKSYSGLEEIELAPPVLEKSIQSDLKRCKTIQDSRNDQTSITSSSVSKRATGNPKTASHIKIDSPKLVQTLGTHQDIAQPRILMLCNHISTADVPLIMQAFSTLKRQSLLWVLDAQFKPTNFGLVSLSHEDFFIAKNKFIDGSLRDHLVKHPERNLLVLFPEGGFLRKRLDGSNRFAIRNNLPKTEYVTHPRFGAFKDLVDPCLNVTHIVDATLLYDDIKNPPSLLDIACGTRKEPVILRYKLYKREEVAFTEEWLRNLWLDKDKFVKQFYTDRKTVYNSLNSMRSIEQDWTKLFAVHLFYLLVFYMVVYKLVNN